MGIPGANDRVIIRACLVLGMVCILTINRVQCVPVGARRLLAGETVFDVVKNFGAKGDGRTDNTDSINTGWNKVCKTVTGPARLVIPPGNYVAGELVWQGPCTAKPMTVEIQGNLLATSDPSAYQGKAWISVERVDDVIVTGGGTINGRGKAMWQYANDESHLPTSFQFQTVGFGKLYNINFLDSMGFHTKVTDSHDVLVWNLTITAPATSPNTDGIHVSSTTNLNITDLVVGTGDDCVSIGHGCKNVLVARVFCGPGHGLSIGSLGKRPDETDLGQITIINCTLTGTTNGARIKTYHSSPKMQATGIYFQDIVMDQVRNPIIIDQHYHSKSNSKAVPSSVKISDVHFRNIKGTTPSPTSVTLNCSSAFPCEGIELADINLQPLGNVVSLNSVCSNAKVSVVRGGLNTAGLSGCV
ncbi:hypothetical protein RD792_003421 [Penstemon davidsonii]|uniref:Polygalacturonase n=1 Tax=Penstemon davidsonii TaxID=160366 RepID=A0ABR0DU72_9LAMI|nr:hypothetical protein RD792_003417 [Penstemon davidsonii]KAK4492603.1 hypothetical protein RD792_003421 [Penstemon davidsonii]